MAKKEKKKKTKQRDKPLMRSGISILDTDDFKDLVTTGYTTLSKCPEIVAGVDMIAKLIGSMSIHYMQNEENGDHRIKDGLSRMVDITPNEYMNRSNFIKWIVRTMYLEGNGNAFVAPVLNDMGMLEGMRPIAPDRVSIVNSDSWGFELYVNGRLARTDSILHFVLNPDPYRPWEGEGVKVALRDVAYNLKQAAETEKGFMQSKWKPSLIVKVDALIDEFADPEGRKRLLEEYLQSGEAGEPWMIPAEAFAVEQVRPLSLSDLAISDVVELDKRTVASILHVPPYVLGIGEFDRLEWNNFISSTIMPIAQIIEQELTRKILISDQRYFRFNPRSLFSYDLKDLADISTAMYEHGLMRGNEARNWVNLEPAEGLDEFVILENYIPANKIGDQKKLGSGKEEEKDAE